MKELLISKSSFLRGIQCKKSFYLDEKHKNLKNESTKDKIDLFEAGKTVEDLAKKIFPGGIEIKCDNQFDANELINKTQNLLNAGNEILYGASFKYKNCFVITDILQIKENKINIYEVKSSTKIAKTNIYDAAFQYYTIKNSEIQINDFFIIYINNEYKRKQDLEIRELFKIESVKEEIEQIQEDIQNKINELSKTQKENNIPNIDIGLHCSTPYECDFKKYCWKHIPENSIFEIAWLKKTEKFKLYKNGIISQKDIPQNYNLTKEQRIQVNCTIKNKDNIDIESIKRYLSILQYPLYFFDFETYQSPIPIYSQSKPYQKIPFQYSLHYKKDKDSELKHYEFIGNGKTDPRKSLIKQMIENFKEKGLIIVYNESFEKGILEELARDFPEYKDEIKNIISRIRDLMIPFKKKYYYKPELKGSYSIKKILPSIVKELKIKYNDLEIQDGLQAMNTYKLIIDEKDVEKVKSMQKNLLKYCELDTLAMIWIYDELKKL